MEENPLLLLVRPRPRALDPAPGTEITTAPLASLQGALGAVIRSVGRGALEGAYDAILADDTAARVPGIVLRDALAAICAGRGREALPLIFWKTAAPPSSRDLAKAASGDEKAIAACAAAERGVVLMGDALTQRMPLLLAASGGGVPRVLLFTEWIQSGQHIATAVQQLRDAGITVEVATLGTGRGYVAPPGIRVHTGMWHEPTVAGLYQNTAVSGMTREPGTVPTAVRDPELRRSAVVARADAHRIAARIVAGLPPYLSPRPAVLHELG